MRIFKSKRFDKWSSAEGLTDIALISAVDEIAKGLVEVNLGGNVYKKRVKLPGRGKRGGARTLIAYRANDKAFFVYGYSKNERDNIDDRELKAIKELAAELLGYSDDQLKKAMHSGALMEIKRR